MCMQFHAVSCQLGTISASGSASHVASISIISGMDPASSAKILTSSLQKETQKQSRQYHTVSIFSPFHERTISSITDDRVKNRIDRGDTPLCERRFKIDCIAYSNGRIRRPRQTQGGARQGRRQASLAAPAARAGFLYFQYPPTPADSKGERVRAERL